MQAALVGRKRVCRRLKRNWCKQQVTNALKAAQIDSCIGRRSSKSGQAKANKDRPNATATRHMRALFARQSETHLRSLTISGRRRQVRLAAIKAHLQLRNCIGKVRCVRDEPIAARTAPSLAFFVLQLQPINKQEFANSQMRKPRRYRARFCAAASVCFYWLLGATCAIVALVETESTCAALLAWRTLRGPKNKDFRFDLIRSRVCLFCERANKLSKTRIESRLKFARTSIDAKINFCALS